MTNKSTAPVIKSIDEYPPLAEARAKLAGIRKRITDLRESLQPKTVQAEPEVLGYSKGAPVMDMRIREHTEAPDIENEIRAIEAMMEEAEVSAAIGRTDPAEIEAAKVRLAELRTLQETGSAEIVELERQARLIEKGIAMLEEEALPGVIAYHAAAYRPIVERFMQALRELVEVDAEVSEAYNQASRAVGYSKAGTPISPLVDFSLDSGRFGMVIKPNIRDAVQRMEAYLEK